MSTLSAPERSMGKVVVHLTIANRLDQARAEAGDIAAGQVRTLHVDDVLVDTGATTLALPANVIAMLGLALRREVPIMTAAGPGTARLFRDAELTIEGRSGTFDCLELPPGTTPLLGVIPLEALGLEPDLRNQRLRLLPEEPGNTYYTIYGATA